MPRHAEAPHDRPVLLLSSRSRLTRRHGAKGFRAIDAALADLRRALPGRQTLLVYVDDEQSARAAGAAPVSPDDPAAIRVLVEQVERRLCPSSRVALWLIGGHSIVPFFELPNPADDPDGPFPSDAPYACAGDDYFRPVRPVSRLPDGGNRGPAFVHAAVAAVEARRRPTRPGDVRGSGYTASVWREAAREVFATLDGAAQLRMSPPWGAREYHHLRATEARVKYFNLHGKPDGAVWYGQTDPALAATYPDFPVALRQSDVAAGEARGAVVITEACYGAGLAPYSIANRFLRLGASALLGSTAMAYGAITPPVTGADLLAKEYVRYLLAGWPAADAYLAARTALARTMMAEQGFLDAEDQKTLLSFALFGDPTLTLAGAPAAATAVADLERAAEPPSEVVCARSLPEQQAEPPTGSLLEELVTLASWLMSGGEAAIGQIRQGTCNYRLACEPRRLDGSSAHPNSQDMGRVIGIRQELPTGATRLARFTVRDGRIRKAMVSR